MLIENNQLRASRVYYKCSLSFKIAVITFQLYWEVLIKFTN